MRVNKTAGVILAGGRSRRMGVPHKALLPLDGQMLLAHVIGRLKPQLGSLLISSGDQPEEFDSFGLPVIPDLIPSYRGPLMGLYSALHHLAERGQDHGLVLCPCDTPFIPSDLVPTLLGAVHGDRKPVVVVSYEGVLQPTFSMWQIYHLPSIYEAAVTRGQGGLKHLLVSLPHVVVEWTVTEPPPFFNINTPAELKTAAAWLDYPPA